MILIALSSWIDLILTINLLITILTFFMGFSWMIFLKYSQIADFLERCTLKKANSHQINTFRIEHCRLFLFVDRVVREYSGSFLVFLLGMIPTNVFFIGTYSQLLTGKEKNLVESILLLSMIIGQIFGMFGVHLICTMYSYHIHRSGIRRLMLFDANLRFHSLRTHWKMCNYIEKFHTNNQYGYTYGKFGLINIRGFAKVYTSKLLNSIRLILIYFNLLFLSLVHYDLHEMFDEKLCFVSVINENLLKKF